MNAKHKWSSDANILMNAGKDGFTLSLKDWHIRMQRYLFKFIINKVHEVSQCEETEFYDCVHSDDFHKWWSPFYHCAEVCYFNNKFGDEVKQFDLYEFKKR